MTSNIVLSTEEFEVVGTRPIRHDGTDKVTGRARYSADITLPGLLYGKMLRSPHAHARIKSIDTSRALALPGVYAVVTSKDLPPVTANRKFKSNNCLADDKALYKGHAVAAVAATSLHLAEEALSLIEVDYEVLKPVVDVLEAMKEDAPLLHDDLGSDDVSGKATNIANHVVFEVGDIEQGFREADVIVEGTYKTSPWEHAAMEQEAALAYIDEDGRVTIRAALHHFFPGRDWIASMLGLEKDQVRIICQAMGGNFGMRGDFIHVGVSSLLTSKTGKPVKLEYTREESILGSSKDRVSPTS